MAPPELMKKNNLFNVSKRRLPAVNNDNKRLKLSQNISTLFGQVPNNTGMVLCLSDVIKGPNFFSLFWHANVLDF